MSSASPHTNPAKQPQPTLPLHVRKVPRFDYRDDKELEDAKTYMREHGMVVFRNVATASQCTKSHDLAWDWIEAQVPSDHTGCICRHKPETWTNEYWPHGIANGVVKYSGCGNSPMSWHSREIAAPLFQRYHKTDRLVTSLDGFSVFRGSEHKIVPPAGWIHEDLDPSLYPVMGDATRPQSIQGILLFTDAYGDKTGSFTFVDGSHKYLEKDPTTYKRPHQKRGHFVITPNDHDVFTNPETRYTAPITQAGDMILFYSHLLHANITPNTGNKATKAHPELTRRLRRLASYVTMLPAPDNAIDMYTTRITAVQEGWTTCHWSTLPCKNNKPRLYQKKRVMLHNTPNFCKWMTTPWSETMSALILGTPLPPPVSPSSESSSESDVISEPPQHPNNNKKRKAVDAFSQCEDTE